MPADPRAAGLADVARGMAVAAQTPMEAAVADWMLAEAELAALPLEPAESMALTVALAQLGRGEPVMPNIAGACVLGLGRLAGKVAYDGDGGYGLP